MKTRRRIQRKRSTRKQKGGGKKTLNEDCSPAGMFSGDTCDTASGLQCSKTEKRCVPDKDCETFRTLIEGGGRIVGRRTLIQTFLTEHPSIINRPLNTDGETALHIAARTSEDPELIKLLLETGHADRSVKTGFGLNRSTALVLAISKQHLENVRQLIATGTPEEKMIEDINSTTDTPLQQAIKTGNLEIVKVLLAGGAAPNGRNGYGGPRYYGPTPLMTAIESNQKSIAMTLIPILSKSEINAVPCAHYDRKRRDWEEKESTALTKAVITDDIELVQALLAAGADPNIIDERKHGQITEEQGTALRYAKDSIAKILIPKMSNEVLNRPFGSGFNKETYLQHATEINSVEVVEALLNAGADPNASEGSYHNTALIIAIVNDRPAHALALIPKMSLDGIYRHTATHSRTRSYDEFAHTIAARQGMTEVVKALLAKEPDPNVKKQLTAKVERASKERRFPTRAEEEAARQVEYRALLGRLMEPFDPREGALGAFRYH